MYRCKRSRVAREVFHVRFMCCTGSKILPSDVSIKLLAPETQTRVSLRIS